MRKYFDAPNAKFICATLAQTSKDSAAGGEKSLIDAMLSIGDFEKHPQFKGQIATIYAHRLSKGGASNSHNNGNAETYMNVAKRWARRWPSYWPLKASNVAVGRAWTV